MTAATLTLTEFLLARIAEDEAVAQDANKYLRPGDYIDITLSMHDRESGESHSKRIRPWQPERALAECEVKRRLIEDVYHDIGLEFGFGFGPGETMLKLLALPYADHPDYDPAWRP